jgi:hypothetical protein
MRDFFTAVLLIVPLLGFGRAPVISHTTPGALIPGQTTELVIHGEHLASVTGLWTSFQAKTELAKGSAHSGDQVRFNVTLPNGPLGLGAIRLASTNGISNLHVLPFDSFLSVVSTAANQTPDSAQELSIPMAVDGACRELGLDYYKFHGEAGQWITIEVLASRIGSALDPLLRLLDGTGKELAVCDDAPGLGPDALLRFQIPESGSYFVEVRDSRYQGGAKHRYRLRVGFAEPAKLAMETAAVREWLLPAPDLPVVEEIEPNDRAESATPFAIPSLLKGAFSRPGDRDWFEFKGEKGRRLLFTGRTRSLGSPCDLLMQIQNEQGKILAENNPSLADEGVLTNHVSEPGIYRLLVRELVGQGGPELDYQIEAVSFQPGFVLRVEADKLDGAPGQTVALKVTSTRRDYDGPVTLAVHSNPAFLSVKNNVIAEKKNETELKLLLSDDSIPGQWINLTVLGSARIGGSDFETRASTLPAIQKQFPLLLHPPHDLDGLIVLGIKHSGEATETNPAQQAP